MTPRLFVDGRMAFHSGIGRYLRNHLTALRKFPFEVVVGIEGMQHRRWLERYIEGPTDHLVYRSHPFRPRGILQFARPGFLFRATGADLFWFPHLMCAPLLLPERSVVTVHDLIPLREADGIAGRARQFLFRTTLSRVARYAAAIVCVSEKVADEVAAIEPQSRSRLSVVGNGVLTEYWIPLQPAQQSQIKDSLGIGRYILTVGIAESRKNQRLCLDILAALPLELSDVSIVIAGEVAKRKGKVAELEWRSTVEAWRAKHPHLSHRLLCLGEVNEFQLWKLYAAADIFIFPSLDEGFGLPVLEAMASGTPVIVSDLHPLIDIAGEHSLRADPVDVHSWVRAIAWFLFNPAELQIRRELGVDYVRRRWPWSQKTQQLCDIFERVLRTGASES